MHTPRREFDQSDDAITGALICALFNHTYQRTGTLWEGRYKACLVQEEDYLLQVYRYIELNPVRAGMVVSPADYLWSSYQINANGKISELCTPHPLYLALGSNDSERQANYRALVANGLGEQQVKNIRTSRKTGGMAEKQG